MSLSIEDKHLNNLSLIHRKFYFYEKFLNTLIIDRSFIDLSRQQTFDANIQSDEISRTVKNQFRRFQKIQQNLEKSSSLDCLLNFEDNLNWCDQYLREEFEKFSDEIKELCYNLGVIKHIERIYEELDHLNHLNDIVLKNIKNLKVSLDRRIVKNLPKENYRKIMENVQDRFSTDLQETASQSFTENCEFREKLEEEIRQHNTQLQFRRTEILNFQRELYSSETSIETKKAVSQQKMKVAEEELVCRMKSIEKLERTISDLNRQLSVLHVRKEEAEGKLYATKSEFDRMIAELNKLTELNKHLNRNASEVAAEFKAKISDLEIQRLAILNDPNLTEEERQKLLTELDNKIQDLKKEYTQALHDIEGKREKLTSESNISTQNLETMREAILTNYANLLADLEARKLGATPSELKLIEGEIAQLKEKFQQELNMINRLKTRVEYFVDENGRYYIRSDGVKVYKESSTASEYILGENGCLTKIKDRAKLFMDELGDYYLDENGEKIYIRACFEDEYGRYYVDAEGRKIYKRDPYGSEYMLVNGIMIRKSSERVCSGSEGERKMESSISSGSRSGDLVAFLLTTIDQQ